MKRQRTQTYLEAAPAKFRLYIRREKSRVAAGHIEVYAGLDQQSVEHGVKLAELLNLVDDYAVFAAVSRQRVDIRKHILRLAQLFPSKVLQRYGDDMTVVHAVLVQPASEESAKQIRFAAAPHACDYFYKAVAFISYQPVYIRLASEFHPVTSFLLREITNICNFS